MNVPDRPACSVDVQRRGEGVTKGQDGLPQGPAEDGGAVPAGRGRSSPQHQPPGAIGDASAPL